jgi:phage-related protein
VFDDVLILAGTIRTIVAAKSGSESLALQFLQRLEQQDQRKMMQLFKIAADNWPMSNIQKFRKLSDKIFEFKSFQLRIPCFEVRGAHARLVVLTHGFTKKTDAAPRTEIERAERLRTEFLKSDDAKSPPYSIPPEPANARPPRPQH